MPELKFVFYMHQVILWKRKKKNIDGTENCTSIFFFFLHSWRAFGGFECIRIYPDREAHAQVKSKRVTDSSTIFFVSCTLSYTFTCVCSFLFFFFNWQEYCTHASIAIDSCISDMIYITCMKITNVRKRLLFAFLYCMLNIFFFFFFSIGIFRFFSFFIFRFVFFFFSSYWFFFSVFYFCYHNICWVLQWMDESSIWELW